MLVTVQRRVGKKLNQRIPKFCCLRASQEQRDLIAPSVPITIQNPHYFPGYGF